MKKIVFAIQVFALIALLPMYVIVELNHGIEKLPVKNFSPDFIEKTEKTNIQPALIDEDKQLSVLILK